MERPHVERPIFRKFEILNIKNTKARFFIFKLIFYFTFVEIVLKTYKIIYKIGNFRNFDSLTNC